MQKSKWGLGFVETVSQRRSEAEEKVLCNNSKYEFTDKIKTKVIT